MLYIGDVHGKFERYKKILQKSDRSESIQVGDMGVGFRNLHGDYSANPPYDAMTRDGARHLFFRGNHDNPMVCRSQSLCIPDGTIIGDQMIIGGAFSVDWMHRIDGFSWWKDEECSMTDFSHFIDIAVTRRPAIMVTHDCPSSIVDMIHSENHIPPSRTQIGLQAIFEFHQPDYWIFGHHHKSFRQTVDGTTFICLNELETVEIS